MLLTKEVETKWNSKTKKYYEDLGYSYTKIGEKLFVKVEHLKPTSREKVLVECDYKGDNCLGEIEKEYQEYLKQRKIIEKDCCKNCKSLKQSDVMIEKYGVDNISKTVIFKNKYKEIMNEKYGVDNYFEILDNSEENNHLYKPTFVKCNNCNKEVHRKESWINKNNLNFCCVECKKEYYDNNSKQPKNKRIRKSKEYYEWRNKVLEKDNYTCQCCGNENKRKLRVHHIENFNQHINRRFDIHNGVTLCENCHSIKKYGSFHNVYGSTNNNLNQLNEYIKRFKNGEFDNLRKQNKKYTPSKIKKCATCKIDMPNTNEYFVKDKSTKDELTYNCKWCRGKNGSVDTNKLRIDIKNLCI